MYKYLLLNVSFLDLFGSSDETTGYAYSDDVPVYGSGYEAGHQEAGYQGFSKRKGLDLMAPVLSALTKGKERYETQETDMKASQ